MAASDDRDSGPDRIVLACEPDRCGAYVLRIAIARPLAISFGRFMGGEAIAVPAGECLYVGSARGGGNAMAHRLVRHATRTGGKPPHGIRASLLELFASDVARSPAGKRLHWHIDYLLDSDHAEVSAAILFGDALGVERDLAARLNADPCTSPIALGLGAQDDRGNTHLLQVVGDDTWWRDLPDRLAS